jgi:hypothetical protein
MRTFVVRFAYTVAALVLALLMHVLLASQQSSRDDVAARRVSREVARVRTHLGRVEAELRAADVSHLSMAQRSARAHHIEVLRAYREAGVFPHNHVLDGRYSPVFVDEHGTHCAVGYLIAQSGRKDIVRRIASTRNYATVHQLADEPGLAEWLHDAGISLEEAARIQPEYFRSDDERPSDPLYTDVTAAATFVNVVMIGWNLSAKGRTLPGVLGVGLGLSDIALGGFGIWADAEEGWRVAHGYIALNLGVGLLSTALGVRTLFGQVDRPADPTSQPDSRDGLQWSLSPWRPAPEGGAGLRVDLRF